MKLSNLDRVEPVWRRPLAIALVAIFAGGGSVLGQVGVEDYNTKPILTRNSSAHFSTIKDFAFARDGNELLSAGFDKVIHVWDIGNQLLRPIRTIRPPIFKGEKGQIWSIALSPVEVDGQRLLAVAGHSPATDPGVIVLMRYPGKGPANLGGSGELLGYLRKEPNGPGQAQTYQAGKITKLAFSRNGRHLVSANIFGFMNLWDLSGVGKAQVDLKAVNEIQPLTPARPLVNKFPITSMVLAGDATEDQWIITGDDGSVGDAKSKPSAGRVCRRDLMNKLATSELPIPLRQDDGISCLGGGGVLQWVVVGTRRGQLWWVDLSNHRYQPMKLQDGRGKIVAVDVSADGKRIAASVQKESGVLVSDPPPIDGCEVLLFKSPDGMNWTERPLSIAKAKFPIEAIRFGRDRLALGGDEDQGIAVHDGPGFDRPPLKIPGRGSVIWDVGFVDQPDSKDRAIAFSRDSADFLGRRRAGIVKGFNLTRRSLEDDYDASRIFRADPGRYGFTVAVANPYKFQVAGPGINPRMIALEPSRDGGWYSYTFLPPTAGKAPLLAVGTEFGISVFNLANGKRTRYLQGHEGTVTALGVSPDGKWLISGSVDQSIRLWATKDFDQVLKFGAKADLIGGELVVTSVEPGSVAELRGLRKNDRIQRAFMNPKRTAVSDIPPVPRLDQFLADADALEADLEIELKGVHDSTKEELAIEAKKRTAPTLSLYLDKGDSREWVLWAPQGTYATSIQGDQRYLGWHRNIVKPGREKSVLFNETLGTAFAAIGVFKELQDNPAIDRIIASNDPAIEPVKPLPVEIIVEKPPILEEKKDSLTIRTVTDDPKKEPVKPIIFIGRKELPPEQFIWTKTNSEWIGTISKKALEPFGPKARLAAQILEPKGRSELAFRDFDNPAQVGRQGRLVVFGASVENYGSPYSKLIRAGKDVTDLAGFFGSESRLISPGGGKSFTKDALHLIRAKAAEKGGWGTAGAAAAKSSDPSTKDFLDALDELKAERLGQGGDRPSLQDGDLVLMHLEAHSKFDSSEGGQILFSDWDSGRLPRTAATDLIKEELAAIVQTGCRVYLFLDIVHDRDQNKDGRDRWIRELLDAGVGCFVASKDRPSSPRVGEGDSSSRNRLFAQAIQGVFEVKSNDLNFTGFAEQVKTKAKRIVGDRNLDPDYFNYFNSRWINPSNLFITDNSNR